MRVIPRDFFNEAKLLKCMGQLSLKILDCQLPDGIDIHIEDSGELFLIHQSEDDGSLYISNYQVGINGIRVRMKTKYNSKDNYPLYCESYWDEILVFDEQGNFSQEFIEHFKQQEPCS